MRIFITGANGFLGSSLAAAFESVGHEVHGSVRTEGAPGLPPRITAHLLSLGEDCHPSLFAGCDTLVHCAHDFAPNARRRNIEGTQALARAARDQGVAQQLFIGSYSAHEGARGEYAETKRTLERFFVDEGWTVLKLGLVIGGGGLFARIVEGVRRFRVAPLVGRGYGVVPVLAMADFVAATASVIASPSTGVIRLYLPERVTLRALVAAALEATGTRALLVPVPGAALTACVRIAERGLGLRLPVSADSFEAFRANQEVFDTSDLPAWVEHPTSLHEMVKQSARALEAG